MLGDVPTGGIERNGLTPFVATELRLDLARNLSSTATIGLLEDLTEIADNFVGVDLRATWVGRAVRAISVETTPGIFQAVGNGRDGRRSLHAETSRAGRALRSACPPGPAPSPT